MNEMKFFNGILERPTKRSSEIDDIGGPDSHTNYPWGWAQCGNSPFKWYKQNTHEGGVHVPMIVHWPGRIAADQAGTKRDQFVYVSDIVPTIYDLLGVTPPDTYRGIDAAAGDRPLVRVGARPSRRTGHQHAPVLRVVRQPGARRRLDGVWWKAVSPPAGGRLRHRPLGAVSTSPPIPRSATTGPTPSPTDWPR